MVPWDSDLSCYEDESFDTMCGHFDFSSKYLIASYIEEQTTEYDKNNILTDLIKNDVDQYMSDPTQLYTEDVEKIILNKNTTKSSNYIGSFVDKCKRGGTVFSGHFHGRREFNVKDRNFIIIGAPFEQNFGDVDKIFGFYIQDVKNNKTKFNQESDKAVHDFASDEKIKKFVETQAAIKFSRRCLMACVTGLEFLNKKFDPFSVKLEGWSENVMENVDDYDNIFERLHEKYSGKTEIAPEIELLLTLGGSAFMFHLTNTLLKGPMMGNLVAQNNPNFMSSMMGAMSDGMKEMNKPPTGASMAGAYQQNVQQREAISQCGINCCLILAHQHVATDWNPCARCIDPGHNALCCR
jgi:hypothetical protein